MFRHLRHQLTAWYLSILALVLVAFGVGSFLATQALLLGAIDETNRRSLAPYLERFGSHDESMAELVHELSELGIGERDHLAILTPRGRVLFARGQQLDPEPPLQLGASNYPGTAPMRLYLAPLKQPYHMKGYVRIGRSLDGSQQALRIMALTMGTMIPLALLLAWVGGSWLAVKAVRPVEEAMARERQLTRDASHELRTPLSVLLSQAQLALEGPDLPAPLASKLEVIVKTVRKMSTLVEDLLTLGRGDAGIQGKPLRFSLMEVVEDELQALDPLATEHGASFELSPASDGAWVTGDPGQVAQVIRNLLDNALRYGRAPIRLSFGCTPESVSLSVSNAGEPLTSEDLERVFDRFFRADAGRALNPDGSGLGLAIARAIARAHGGDLVARSSEAETVFTLRLPKASGRS